MAGELASEEPQVRRQCSSCGASADESARYCAACGRPLADTAPDVDVGGWVEAGWRLFVSNIAPAVGIPLVLVIPTFAFALLSYFGFIGMMILSEPQLHAPKVAPIIFGAIVGLVVMVLTVTMPALQGGVYACFLEGIRTGKLTADRFWDGFRHWWACTWVSWVLGAAMGLCLPFMFILVGIPAFLGLLSLSWLSLFRIVERRRGGIEALSFAWGVMRGRLWTMLLYTFLLYVLMSGGAMAMYFGVVVTFPIGIAAMAAGYDSLSKKQNLRP